MKTAYKFGPLKDNDTQVAIADLLEAEHALPALLRYPARWKRLRVSLHRIHPTVDPVLVHKHRWPAAFRVVRGRQEVGITHHPHDPMTSHDYAPGVRGGLPMLARLVLPAGSLYEMNQTDALHCVRPLDGRPTLSVMVTRGLYAEASSRKESVPPGTVLSELDDNRRDLLLADMARTYRGQELPPNFVG